MTTAYKVFTNDLRSPVQGGKPVWDGRLPFVLPETKLDRSEKECGYGWNFCAEPETALRISGLWPDGRPTRLFLCEIPADHIVRGKNIRAATGNIVDEVKDFRPALLHLYCSLGDVAGGLADETILWREALSRPSWDETAVESMLREALGTRGLGSNLSRFDTIKESWLLKDTRVAWGVRDTRAASAANAAWDSWMTRLARDAGDTSVARAFVVGNSGWWGVGNTAAVWDACRALTVWVAARKGWTEQDPNLLTAGIRDAYRHGLGIVLPVAENTLGWAMEGRESP